ncbi:MAG: phosphotransferase family protein [Dehalococcoidia bacterium]|nr:phosphotransferase family protein [Dehalococcoidia bacterium]
MSDASMADALAGFISRHTGRDASVRSVQRIPGGFSYETWRVEGEWAIDGEFGPGRLILRKAPRGGVLEPYDVTREFRVLQALENTPVPAPRAFWCEPSGDLLGTPFYLMEFVEGDVPLPWSGEIAPAERDAIHRQFTGTLAALHSLDWEALGLAFLGVPPGREDPAALELDRCEEVLQRIALRPYPLLREIISHLRAHRPRCPRLALVHDDYRMGNFVWREGRIAAFLDWERAFIGDPMADIAFTRLGLGGWCSVTGEMTDRYTAQSGIAVDEERVAYYMLLEQLKATLVGLTGLKAFAEGRTSDLRLVQIGRGAHQGILALATQVGLTA